MAWQRKIPFGYKMAGGEIVLHQEEAEAVAFIYDSYRGGDSYLTIANAMSELGIRYHRANPEWNKHMVKRILENPKYAGQGEYPTILSADLWHRAQDVRDGKTAAWVSQPVCVEMVKRRFYCGECGSAISKDASSIRGTRWWHCSNTECPVTLMIKDTAFEEAVTALLNRLITSPELLGSKEPSALRTSLEAVRMQNEINRELGKADMDEDYLTALILGCAAEKYAVLDDGSEQRKIARLKTELVTWPLLTSFDPAMFNETAEALLVMADKSLALRVPGGNIITENNNAKENLNHANHN